jgi:inositol transporter-like SP family MFS transporter
LRGLYSRRSNIVALLFLFGVYGLWGLVAGQAGIFMPRIYDSAGLHGAVAQDLLQVLLWGCTVAATFFGFMAWADRISQRLLYGIGAALGVVGWLVLVFLSSAGLPALLTFAVLWGVSCGVGAQAFYGLWASEMFATPYRASAQGTLFFAARIAIGALSFFFRALLSATGLPAVGSILIALLVLALIIGSCGAPETRGKTLQQTEAERYGHPTDRLTSPAEASADEETIPSAPAHGGLTRSTDATGSSTRR